MKPLYEMDIKNTGSSAALKPENIMFRNDAEAFLLEALWRCGKRI